MLPSAPNLKKSPSKNHIQKKMLNKKKYSHKRFLIAFLFMTFYYYFVLVVLPLRLKWRTRVYEEENPINVNAVVVKLRERKDSGRTRKYSDGLSFPGRCIKN